MSQSGELRADAAANRVRILQSAEVCAWEQGLDVSMQTIAARAGIGQGTLYRHFPDRPALLKAILVGIIAELDDGMRQAETLEDPYERLLGFLHVAVRLNLAHPIVNELWTRILRDDPSASIPNPWEAAASRTVAEAKAQGRIRPDAELVDFALLPRLLSALSSAPEDAREQLSERFLAIFLAGLAPDTTAPIASPGVPDSVIHHFLRNRVSRSVIQRDG